jgi:hypothetical protein
MNVLATFVHSAAQLPPEFGGASCLHVLAQATNLWPLGPRLPQRPPSLAAALAAAPKAGIHVHAAACMFASIGTRVCLLQNSVAFMRPSKTCRRFAATGFAVCRAQLLDLALEVALAQGSKLPGARRLCLRQQRLHLTSGLGCLLQCRLPLDGGRVGCR